MDVDVDGDSCIGGFSALLIFLLTSRERAAVREIVTIPLPLRFQWSIKHFLHQSDDLTYYNLSKLRHTSLDH